MAKVFILKSHFFSFINVLGLAIGMSSAIFIWVHGELTYDKFLDNYDRLGLVVEQQNYQGREKFSVPVTPGPLARALEEEIPEIENAIRFQRTYMKVILKKDEKVFTEKHIAVAGPTAIFIAILTVSFQYNTQKSKMDIETAVFRNV
jgi:putative ABC transport system permease protein